MMNVSIILTWYAEICAWPSLRNLCLHGVKTQSRKKKQFAKNKPGVKGVPQIHIVFESRCVSREKTRDWNAPTTLMRGKVWTFVLGRHKVGVQMCAFIKSFDLGSPIKGMRRIATERADKIWSGDQNVERSPYFGNFFRPVHSSSR